VLTFATKGAIQQFVIVAPVISVSAHGEILIIAWAEEPTDAGVQWKPQLLTPSANRNASRDATPMATGKSIGIQLATAGRR
jgi:hypothetical protein